MKPPCLLAASAVAAIASLASLAVSCYEPEPQLGLPCSSQLECPSGQRCVMDAGDGPRCLDSSQSGGEDGNDRAEDATDVSDGGTFPLDFSGAKDDAGSSCAAGRPELFFELSLRRPEVIYIDTFGSAVDTAITVVRGDCEEASDEVACVDDVCGGAQSQGAWSLAAGEYCLRVDGPAASGDGAQIGKLVVVRGENPGEPLPMASGAVSGDTCGDDNSNDADSCGCEPAKDHHYFFTMCPGTAAIAKLDTCGASWDTVLQLRFGSGEGLACDDDGCAGVSAASEITRRVNGPGLFWAIVDGCEECGAYTMKYSLTPTATTP
jgi:hypothetical protein